jgi:DNA-binding NtrC family response regulator
VAKILIIEDEEQVRSIFHRFLQRAGHEVVCAGTYDEALSRMSETKCDLILSDIVLGGNSGITILRECRRRSMSCPVIMITGYPSVDTAAEALRLGAFDYILKPVKRETLLEVAERALQHKKAADAETGSHSSGADILGAGVHDEPCQRPHSSCDLGTGRGLHNIVGKSRPMQIVYSLIESLADVESSVLITGESGTGKELAAEALHYLGPRKNKPLIKVNCSALSESLLESELFGHVKGAFTGAIQNKMGRFQKAEGGTIFLDEIGDLSRKMQATLLRILEKKHFEPVGDSTPLRMAARVIAATNKDLEAMVRVGEFRADLLFRLRVVELQLPPLRARRDDIPLLVEHFLARFNREFNLNVKTLSPEVERIFQDYSWPGNIRELEHALEHALIFSNGDKVVSVVHLPLHVRQACKPDAAQTPDSFSAKGNKSRLAEIVRALEQTGGNKQRAARLLGVDRKTLYRRLAKYNVPMFKKAVYVLVLLNDPFVLSLLNSISSN